MVAEQTLAFVLFFMGLFVFVALSVMIFYYDRQYYGDDASEVEPGGTGGEP